MPMKIAIFNYSSSGLFHYASCLVNTLARTTDAKILFLTSSYNNLDLIEPHPRVRILAQKVPHHLPGFFRWLANPREQLCIFRAIRKFDPDVIHITDSHAVYVPHQWWLKRYRIIFTQHDPVSHQGDVYRFSSRIIHHTQQRLAHRIVAHGEFIKKTLIEKKGVTPDKIFIIPHGDYSFYLRWRKKDIRPVPNSVLFFGRIVDYKGLDTLLESLIQLQNQSIPVSLILAGNGNLTKYQSLLKQVKNKIIDNRTIPDSEVIKYFQMSTILALPYREASQSGIISIAMPAGLPIIATKVGSLSEILADRKNSLLVEPNNPSALAKAIKQLLQDKHLRESLVAGARQTVSEKTSWPICARQYYQLYQSVL
ncbi:MAG: glycosyltransferase family 4 protein [bacterium]